MTTTTTSFANQLFTQLLACSPEKNVLCSPASVQIALQMLADGATGRTRTEILRVLGTDEVPVSDETLQIANSLWTRADLPARQAYVDLLVERYNAHLGTFNPDKAGESAEEINGWVSKNTHEMIKNLISANAINADTILFLINAVAFRGTWQEAFDEAQTRDMPFELVSGEKKTVAMMQKKIRVGASFTDEATIVSLPYETDYCLTLAMPEEGIALADYAQKFSLQPLEEQKTRVVMPRLNLKTQVELSTLLKTLGITSAFDETADLSVIRSDNRLTVSSVLHEACMEVDEKGTVAAAATAISMTRSAGPFIPTAYFNRPFLVVLSDKEYKHTLFMGAVYDPS